jgi:hypothetical protein
MLWFLLLQFHEIMRIMVNKNLLLKGLDPAKLMIPKGLTTTFALQAFYTIYLPYKFFDDAGELRDWYSPLIKP